MAGRLDVDEGAGGRTKSVVLIVDDEPDIREAVGSILTTSVGNVRTVTAGSGRDALRILEDDRVDLIVADYKMPGMDGLKFLAHARRLAPDVPRIMITAFPDVKLAIQAINDEHIESFLTKPLDETTIVDTVESILARRKAEQMRARAFARSLELTRRQLESR